ncbi:DEAD/DEAH box helicase [Candidatus Leptofilum sp.]|uniref:DEAD/DEAH box helicase n=1 Tax=Candidatus Leptofilum sp. TaxID=3241576 RepID=UPI003B5AFC31
MIDEFAQGLIINSQIPSQLSAIDARDMLSRSYLSWLERNIFNGEGTRNSLFGEDLRRLSLASSILHNSENEDSNNADSTAFLVAEAGEVSTLLGRADLENISASQRFRKLVRFLDLASYYHLADYDANASVTAKFALSFDFGGFNTDEDINDAHLSYYRCLGQFLRGKFNDCRDEAEKEISGSTSEEKAFLFLRTCLANLTNKYKNQGDNGIDRRLSNLQSALQNAPVTYFSLLAETLKLMAFYSAVPRKSSFQLLENVFSDQQEYLNVRVSGDNEQSFPFAWPPTRDFCAKYFVDSMPHAVITVPTGGGKSFLAELASAEALGHGWVLYIAPTNALCAQIKTDLRENLNSITNIDVEAYLGKLEYSGELPQFQIPRQVLVVTPEKALLLLKRQSEIFKKCSAVVLDECHLLGSKNRGDIAEIVLAFCLSQNPEVRIILMSALVQDSNKLAAWLNNKTGKEVIEIDLNWRPTRISRLTIFPDWETLERPLNGNDKYSVGVKAFGDTVTPWREDTPLESWLTPIRLEHKNTKFPWRNDVTRNLATIFTNNNIPTLVFVLKNKHEAFSIAGKYDSSSQIPEEIPATQKEYDLAIVAKYELGTPTILEELINEKRAAVHTSVMLNCERELSEISFANGRALLLVATGTLSQGLNLAAKAAIICGTQLSEYGTGFNIDPDELQRLSLSQVLNATGRAARANIACRGISVIVPDSLRRDEQAIQKSEILRTVPVLQYKDASLQINSPLKNKFQASLENQLDDPTNEIERSLLALLPTDNDNLNSTVRFTLGSYEIEDGESTETVIRRLDSIKTRAIEDGHPEWILEAASFAGIEYELASNLYNFILSHANIAGFTSPDDSYSGWASFLFDWIRELPAPATWDLVKLHIKAWRYSWGSNRDDDLKKLFEEESYPTILSQNIEPYLNDLWENMQLTAQAWLDDKTLLQIGELLTRRESTQANQNKRTSAGHFLPRTIMWGKGFIEQLAQFAGLLLALQNQWVEHEPDTIPEWVLSTNTLHTFPFGLRCGISDPFAAAWYRHVIQERRSANLLQKIAPIQVETVLDLQEVWSETRDTLSEFLQMTDEDEIVTSLRRLLSDSN